MVSKIEIQFFCKGSISKPHDLLSINFSGFVANGITIETLEKWKVAHFRLLYPF
jgi:hypothetical protein